MVDNRVPVIVGVAHHVNRTTRPERVVDAVTLMTEALRSAATDAGAPALLERLDMVAVVQGLWRWPDPARLLAHAVGSPGARTVLAAACGSTPQLLVADAAARISAGAADVVAVCGGEWVHGRSLLRNAGVKAQVTPQLEGRPDEVGQIHPYESGEEIGLGFTKPLFIYPLIESAIRARRHESLADNRRRISGIVSRMSQVAAVNPAAWRADAWSPDDVAEVSDDNPMVAFPYTKRMVSNPKVDMASAILLTSVGMARALGIPAERLVFPHSSAHLHDPHFFSEMDQLAESPNMALAVRTALDLAQSTIDDIAVLDLYSCFPAAVQIEADSLGLDTSDDRPLTVSGGMASFGGPIANYVGHVLVDLVRTLRERPGERGLCVANGGYLNRPAAAVYDTRPPSRPFRRADLSQQSRSLPHRRAVFGVETRSTVESATVLATRDIVHPGLVTGLLPSGERILAWTDDPELTERVRTEEVVGTAMEAGADGRIRSLAPSAA